MVLLFILLIVITCWCLVDVFDKKMKKETLKYYVEENNQLKGQNQQLKSSLQNSACMLREEGERLKHVVNDVVLDEAEKASEVSRIYKKIFNNLFEVLHCMVMRLESDNVMTLSDRDNLKHCVLVLQELALRNIRDVSQRERARAAESNIVDVDVSESNNRVLSNDNV
ncbi:hypothetical protein K6025_04870 [Ehrlichia sp. JZT12]